MFGRNHEILDYTIYPSKEGRGILAEQALERIETVDGTDYLDGFALPPDNEKIWNPISMIVTTTYLSSRPYQTTEEITSQVTNAWIRRANIESIALGRQRQFITPQERYELMAKLYAEDSTPTLFDRLRKLSRSLIGVDAA